MQLFFPALSALLLFLSFHQNVSGYLALIALVPFFHALSAGNSTGKAFFGGLIFGIVHSSLLTYPLLHALTSNYGRGIIYSLLLVLATSIIPYALLYGLFSSTCFYLRSPSKLLNMFLPPSAWIIADYSRELIPFFLPWGFAGYTQVFTPLIQISDLTGIYGVTFCVILVNMLLTAILHDRRNHKYQAALAALLLIVASYSHLRTSHIASKLAASPPSDIIKIASVQGNFTTRERWDMNLSLFRYSTYISLSENNLSGTDIVIWPETVLNSSDKVNLEVIKSVSARLNPGQIFISGATRSDNSGRYYNSVFITSRSEIIDIYDKIILFPYSERSFSGLSAGKFLNAPEKFEPGKRQRVIDTGSSRIGITICFESIYPYFVSRIKRGNADFIINISNDSWFGSTSEPVIHLYSNIARAIESRIPVIRSTNNGISAVIDQTGKVSAVTQLDARDVLKGSISKHRVSSIYSQFGDLIVAAGAVILLAGIWNRISTSI